MTAELILDAQNGTGESPVWVPSEQALYWVDIPGKALHRWDTLNQQHSAWATAQMPACIARNPHGNWIAGMEDGVYQLVLNADGSVTSTLLSRVEHALPGMRFNDGRCDRQGRFWAGTMVMDMAQNRDAGVLYRYSGGHLSEQFAGFTTPNGLAFSPDGATMYLSDSHPSVQRIWAFDYDTASGTPHNRRLFVDMNAYPGRPDGAAMDSDGCYWICGNDAGLIHRFTPEGKLDRSVAVPVKKPAMCAFGGRELDTLYVTSIRPGGDVSDQPLAGGVFAIDVGVRGVVESQWQG
ncbi:MAG: SMP-30/gluconolactonase/LRE family protein [Pseudomonas sp.]|uniref:SMP-30/gluconolactonase/LRE family protein n=1 Tax=Pseudomonas abieticivorans TaxID=2931382 RepID=UPI0020BD7950|nr:SMP-30/gluconolactonase/LRE family protein [Pseudomonas sp. PIA16]MDE1169288.1 SMP-30/gluconolactonase/LRE family protein [Pseudomonas sp.]